VGIFIKNPEVERKARKLAKLKGKSLTAAIEGALDRELREQLPPERRPSLEEMRAATERFRRVAGLDKGPYKPITKAEWDAMWPLGIAEIDEAWKQGEG
jgi:antitoxin VapB